MRSTNPHFGVFLPPVALVGDPSGTPEPIRLQINQVRVLRVLRASFARDLVGVCSVPRVWVRCSTGARCMWGCWCKRLYGGSIAPPPAGTGCDGGVRGICERMLVVQGQLMRVEAYVLVRLRAAVCGDVVVVV